MDTEAFTAKRRRLGWSLRDVERDSGIAFSTLARFERGERVGVRVAAGIATWVADPDPRRRVEVALTREGKYLVGYSNEGEAGGFILLGDITDQLATFASPAAEREEVETRFWSIIDDAGLAAVPSDMWPALETISRKASHYEKLVRALHDAICSPKGVVPDSADPYYRSSICRELPDALLAKRPTAEVEGWIVGNNIGQWRTFDSFGWAWTDRRDLAIRYARREDAELVHGDDEDSWRVEQYPAALGGRL